MEQGEREKEWGQGSKRKCETKKVKEYVNGDELGWGSEEESENNFERGSWMAREREEEGM